MFLTEWMPVMVLIFFKIFRSGSNVWVALYFEEFFDELRCVLMWGWVLNVLSVGSGGGGVGGGAGFGGF